LPDDGRVIDSNGMHFRSKAKMRYAFCSDTAYNGAIIPLINGVDVLYHESTFYNQKSASRKTMHSTAKEAATIALKAR
jgi:ribonuclease Z